MKRKTLLPIFLLSAFILGGCNPGGNKTSSSSDTTQYGVEIANKDALKAEWHAKGATRELEINLTPEGNVLLEINNKNLVISSSDTNVVSVSGITLTPAGEGTATITVDYHGVKDTVELTVAAEQGEPAHVTATVEQILANVAAGKEKDVIYDIEVYVAAWQSGKTDPTKYGNYMIADAKGAAADKQILVYGSSANTDAFTFTFASGAYSYTQGDAAKDFLTNEKTKDVGIGSKLTMSVIAYSYSGTPEVSGIVKAVDNSTKEAQTETPEPAVKASTLAEFIADKQGNGKQAFTFDAKVKYFKTADATEAEQYGNLTLTDDTNDLVVYGSTGTESALEWVKTAAQYKFTNPKDFVTNEFTKGIKLGDTVTVKFIRADYTKDGNTTIQGTGIILKVNGVGPASSSTAAEVVDTPVAATKYKLGMKVSAAADKTADVYATGAKSSYYGATTEKWAEAADFELVEVTGGYNVKVTLPDSSVKYLNMVVSGNNTNISYDDVASSVFTYDATAKTLFCATTGHTDAAKDGTYFFGTYTKSGSTYTTISCSLVSYIQGDNASKVDVSQFPVHFFREAA